jgi:nucleotide-binding universal stress UspA family protein
MKRILVPTDFSEHAEPAVSIARNLAMESGAEVTFWHALHTPINWGNLPEGWEKVYPGVKEKVADTKATLQKLVLSAKEAGVAARQELAFLEPNQGVAAALRESDYDLIIMGSRGHSGLRRFVMGSNAERVMRTARIPVLIVPEEPKRVDFNTIVFASGMEEDTHPAFTRLIRFSEACGAQGLHFVEVTTPYNFRPTGEVESLMRKYIAPHDFPTLTIHNYVHYTIEAGVLEFARSINADLIAIANHGRNDLSGLFVESIPENLVRHGELPVLSLRV